MSQIILEQQTTPSTPSSGKLLLYAKSDDRLYTLNSAGQENLLLDNYFTAANERTVTANSGTAYTIDLSQGTSFNITLTGNVIFTFTANHVVGELSFFTVKLTQDGTGGRTVSWPGSVKWDSGVNLGITSTANKTDIFTFMSIDPTVWYGSVCGKNF